MTLKKCLYCRKIIKRKKGQARVHWLKKKFCNMKCVWAREKIRRKGNAFSSEEHRKNFIKAVSDANRKRGGEKHYNWRGGKHMQSGGYIEVYAPNHPHKYSRNTVLEHRLVMEKHLGRFLKTNELVHHINENKSDNRIENLKLTNRSEHPRIHFKGKKIK